MFKQILLYLNNFVVFMYIFSIFNDMYLVDYLGENILKIIFLLFFIFNIKNALKAIKSMNLLQNKLFFIFIILLIIGFIINIIIDPQTNILKPALSIMSIIIIVLYFSRYPLINLLYFIWISIMFSIVVCYFSEPIPGASFRKTGGTIDPNEFAAYVLAFYFTSIYLYTINKSKIILFISTLFTVYAIFFAGSKSAFLVFAIVILFILLRFIIYKPIVILNYKLIFVVLILLFGAIQIDFTKIEVIQNLLGRVDRTHSVDVRFLAWGAGVNMVKENPILGVGSMRFAENTYQYIRMWIAPHNTYIQIIAESGIIVFLFYISFIFLLLKQNFRIIINSNLFWLYLALLSILLMSLTIGLTYKKFAWIFIALLMNINYLIRKKLI